MTRFDAVRLVCPDAPIHEDNIRHAATLGLPMARAGMLAGRRAVICGSGPSLLASQTLAELQRAERDGALVVGLKEAIRLLGNRGIACEASVAMDGGAEQVAKVPREEGVHYFLATSCHPGLFAHLRGCPIRLFHSLCGFPGEAALVGALFDEATLIAGGLTVANRAYTLFRWLGAERITLAGCDFGWRDDRFDGYAAGAAHGSKGANLRIRDRGRTDGREWFTRPDLLISAIALAPEIRTGRCGVVGDSLAAALARHDDAYLGSLVRRAAPGETAGGAADRSAADKLRSSAPADRPAQ